jgi:hypothetical protein
VKASSSFCVFALSTKRLHLKRQVEQQVAAPSSQTADSGASLKLGKIGHPAVAQKEPASPLMVLKGRISRGHRHHWRELPGRTESGGTWGSLHRSGRTTIPREGSLRGTGRQLLDRLEISRIASWERWPLGRPRHDSRLRPCNNRSKGAGRLGRGRLTKSNSGGEERLVATCRFGEAVGAETVRDESREM